MQKQWNDDQPIYKQLRDRIVNLILSGSLTEGDAIPSVRALSAEYQINHLTVSKAYQMLVDDGMLEKQRGLGMFITTGARERILAAEKNQFLTVELPKLQQRLAQLGISTQQLSAQLLALSKKSQSKG